MESAPRGQPKVGIWRCECVIHRTQTKGKMKFSMKMIVFNYFKFCSRKLMHYIINYFVVIVVPLKLTVFLGSAQVALYN